MTKEILVVGSISTSEGVRVRQTNWHDGLIYWESFEPLPPRDADEAWGYLNGEILE